MEVKLIKWAKTCKKWKHSSFFSVYYQEAPCDTKCICPPRKHLSQALTQARIRFNWTLGLIKQRRRIRFSEKYWGDRLTLFWIRWWAVGELVVSYFNLHTSVLKEDYLPCSESDLCYGQLQFQVSWLVLWKHFNLLDCSYSFHVWIYTTIAWASVGQPLSC